VKRKKKRKKNSVNVLLTGLGKEDYPSGIKIINGKKYDQAMLDQADKSVKGMGDGRISIDDAKLLLREALDGNRYTPIERATMKYIFDNYKFTPKAKEWLESTLQAWDRMQSKQQLVVTLTEALANAKEQVKRLTQAVEIAKAAASGTSVKNT